MVSVGFFEEGHDLAVRQVKSKLAVELADDGVELLPVNGPAAVDIEVLEGVHESAVHSVVAMKLQTTLVSVSMTQADRAVGCVETLVGAELQPARGRLADR